MKFNMRPLSLDESQGQINAAKESSSSGKTLKWEANTKYFFHLMGPWDGVNVIGRECWDCYGLPNIPGQKFFAHRLYRSFDKEEPGIGMKDPILAVLEKYKKLFEKIGDKKEEYIQSMIPFRPKFFMNGLLVSTIKVEASTQQTIEDSYLKMPTPTMETFGISGKHFETIMGYVLRAEKSQAGSLLNPICVGMIGITRVGSGKESRYSVEIIGTNAEQGITPNRYNLVKDYGEDKVKFWTDNVPNLSKRFPMPSEGKRVEDQIRASALDAILLAELKKFQPEETGPQGTRTNVDQSGDRPLLEELEEKKKVDAVQEQVYTPRMIQEKNLGLEKAPTKSDGTPICLGRHAFVQGTPNKAWCAPCDFANMCKIQGGMPV